MLENNSELHGFKDAFIGSKRYWLIYLVFIAVMGLTTMRAKNFMHPKGEIISFVLVAILGVFCIVYYFMNNTDKDLHKVAFVVILIFGLICCLFVPILNHVDEMEHLVRSEITSQGVVFPDWIGDEKGINSLYNHTSGEKSDEYNQGVGFATIGSMKFYEKYRYHTVLDTKGHYKDKINDSFYIRGSAFEQNPFYGYLPQGIGIFVAKLLDLSVIWILWLGRIVNLIFYTCVVTLAVKKAPCLKMPLIAIACIPVALYHASSVSIDAMIFALGLLSVSYFMYMYKADEKTLDIKHIAIFSVLCLLLGLCKLPYLAFIFLLLLVPKRNFRNYSIIPILLGVLAVGIVGVMWSRYSTPALMHSWRSSLNLVDPQKQLEFLINNPPQILVFLKHTVTDGLTFMLYQLYNFDYAHAEAFQRFGIVCWSLVIFLIVMLFGYPSDAKFDTKSKVGALLIFLIVYYGTFFIQLLTWANVGDMLVRVHMRYYIPLLALIPIIVQIKSNPFKRESFDKYAFVLIIGFAATLIIGLAAKYY